MGFNTKLPPCFRFDPTDGELLLHLESKRKDPNDVNVAFIPLIRMQDHDPSEFPGLGAVMGKDGIMYIFAEWDNKYPSSKRRDRGVKMGSMTGHWRLLSVSEPIRSSNGDEQIGAKKKYDFKVGDSLAEWHMEEYGLCNEEHSQVSICRVSKKCSQARGTTKIDAKVDIRFGEQRHFDHVTEVTTCPKSLRETHSHDHHISYSATETYNSNGQEEGQPYWCNFCSKWCPHDEPFHYSLRNYCNRLHDADQTLLFWLDCFLDSAAKTYNSNGQEEGQPYWCNFCSSWYPHDEPLHRSLRKLCNHLHFQDQALLFLLLPNVGHLGPQAKHSKGEKETAQSCISDTGNGPERETLDMDSGPHCRVNLCSGLYAPKETGYSCRDNVLTTSPPLNVTTLITQ